MSRGGGNVFSLTFPDSGSVDVGVQVQVGGLMVVEVIDTTNMLTIGAALIVIENDLGGAWAGILASSSRATAPTPTFTVVGNAVRVATSGGTGHTISVSGRRPLRIDHTV